MDEIKKQVTLARRQIRAERFCRSLPWTLFASLLVAALAIGYGKVQVLSFDPTNWAASWLIGATAAAFLIAAAKTSPRTCRPLDAAIEIDRRFGLKERISSAVALGEQELKTEAGRALLRDAERRVARLHVQDEFRISLDRRVWLPLLPAIAAFLIAFFVPDARLEKTAQAKLADTAATKRVKKSTEVLRRKLTENRDEAQKRGLKDAAGLFRKLEERTKELSEKDPGDRRATMIKLNDLAREMEQRRKAIGGAEQMKRQFAGLKNIRKGPADRLAEALRDGDFKKAIEELGQIQKKIREGDLDAKDRKKLADQLDQMKKKIQQAAEKHQKAMDDLQKSIDQAEAAGDANRADQLQQQLDRLRNKLPDMNKLGQMCKKLGQAAESLREGDAQNANQQLDAMAQDLEQMQQELDELEMLDEAFDQLAEAKDAMDCKACAGAGCNACQGDKIGDGLGPGQGKGDRPEEKNKIGTYDSRVRQKIGKGKAVIIDYVHGPNVKGKVLEDIKSDLAAGRREEADPLGGSRLPKSQQEHAREYFDRFREGK